MVIFATRRAKCFISFLNESLGSGERSQICRKALIPPTFLWAQRINIFASQTLLFCLSQNTRKRGGLHLQDDMFKADKENHE